MALQKTITTSSNIEVTDAYHRIEYVIIPTKDIVRFTLVTYKDPAYSSVVSADYETAYDIAGDNPIAQAYAYIKTLPEFSDAVDC